MGNGPGFLADQLQRLQAVWQLVPEPYRTLLLSGGSGVVMAVAGYLDGVRFMPLVAATLGTMFLVGYLYQGVLMASAHTERIKKGPPPPKPEPAVVGLSCTPGNSVVLEMTNRGGVGEFVVRGRVIGVSKGYEIPYASTFRIVSKTRLRKGETLTQTIAQRGSGYIWVPEAGSHAVEFQPVYMKGEFWFRLLVVVEQETKDEVKTLTKIAVTIGYPSRGDLLTVKAEDDVDP